MTTYTKMQIDQARAKEELLRRVDAGEDTAQVIAELGLKLKPRSLWKVRKAYREQGWEGLVDHRHGHTYRATPEVITFLREAKKADMSRTGAQLAEMVAARFGVRLSVSRINGLLRKMKLNSRPGRRPSPASEPEITSQPIDRVGAFFPQGRTDRDGGAASAAPGDR